MGFTERLRVIIDVVSDKATAGLHGFRTSVAEADGFAGKLRAGVSSLGTTFKSFITSPQGAAVAIAAAGAAMTVAVSQAMDLSLAVGKLKDQTGLSAEAASRWIEVADEMGLSAETVASLLTKLEQNLGKSPEAFKELGVQVKYAADGSTDANGTLLAVIDTLNKIKDPAARAAAAQKLLGKGWKEASELIAAGSDAVKKKLAEVAGSKIIDEKEIEQARKFRETIDNLKDVGEELVITLGQALIPVLNKVVPVLTDVAEGVADVVGVIEDVADAITSVTDALDVMPELLDDEFLKDYAAGLKETETATYDMGDAHKEAAQAAYELKVKERELNDELETTRQRFEAATRAHDDFMGSLDTEEAIENTIDLLQRAQDEMDEFGDVTSSTTRDLVRAFDKSTAALTGLNTLADKALKISVDTGDLEAAWAIMQNILGAAAAGATFNVVTQNYEGGSADTFEHRANTPKGRAITDTLKAYQRNGGPR